MNRKVHEVRQKGDKGLSRIRRQGYYEQQEKMTAMAGQLRAENLASKAVETCTRRTSLASQLAKANANNTCNGKLSNSMSPSSTKSSSKVEGKATEKPAKLQKKASSNSLKSKGS